MCRAGSLLIREFPRLSVQRGGLLISLRITVIFGANVRNILCCSNEKSNSRAREVIINDDAAAFTAEMAFPGRAACFTVQL